MDWSLIMLLFAAGFALAGLAFLISTAHKVMSKPPPSQNIPPTAQPPTYAQPQSPALPAYNWSLNGSRVQKLALGQGSGGATETPSRSKEYAPGMEEGEFGLIPIFYSSVPARIPVFEPEPVHRAERVYEEPAPVPLPNSVAIPVDDSAPDPSSVATPAAYFREPTTIQDVPERKIKTIFNRAGHASSVADKINPNGEAKNFFRDPEIIEAAEIIIADADPTPQPEPYEESQILDLKESGRVNDECSSESGQKESPLDPDIHGAELEPVIIPEPEPVPEPNPEPIPEPESAPVTGQPNPEPEPEGEQKGLPDPPPDPKPIVAKKPKKKKRARGWKSRHPQKKTPPVPNAPPAERVIPKEEEQKTDPKKKPEPKKEELKKSGLKARGEKLLRELIEKLMGKIPEPIRNIAGPVLFCACIAICLLCVSLFTYFDKHPVVSEPPIIVDIPQEAQDPEPAGEEELEPVVVEETPRYVMAMIGEQEAVSATPDGFEPTFGEADFTDVTFYSLTFAVQLDSDPGTEFQRMQVFDAKTMDDLTSTSSSVLHVYTGEIPSDAYFAAHPVKSAPVVSSAVSDEIITCVFVSLEKKSIYDLKVILSQADNGADSLVEQEVMVNGHPEDFNLTPTYPMGNSLIKLGDQYYVAESGTGIGSVPDENKYVTRKIRCVSLPLTGSVSGLDASSIALFDRQTGERRELPEGTEMYYREDYAENADVMEIAFGIQLSGGSYEEATAFLGESFPGYIIDGQSVLF